MQLNLDLALGKEWEDPNDPKKKKRGLFGAFSASNVTSPPDVTPAVADSSSATDVGQPEEQVDEREWTMEELLAPINYLSNSSFGGIHLPRKARTPTPEGEGVNEGSLDLQMAPKRKSVYTADQLSR